ncbi:MAG: O-antigen ligase family protein [Burkholderiales bacterium]
MPAATFSPLPGYADRLARWAAVVIGFSIPVSVALDNTLLALALAGWLAGGSWREKLRTAFGNPVAVAALALFALLLGGAFHGAAPVAERLHYLGKYSDLLFVPVFLYLFRDPATRRHGLLGFAASLATVLLLSYAIRTGVVPQNPWTIGRSDYPVVFKLHLTHNILMAFGALLFAQLALSAASATARLLWATLAVLAVINVALMVKGITGYLVLCGLALLLGFERGRWRGFGAVAAALAAAAALLAVVPGPLHERASRIITDVRQWEPGRPAAESSAGIRLEFYRNTLAIIAEQPLLGVGTGGFPAAYAGKVRGSGQIAARNPHNEYLHLMTQVGVAGIAALVYLFHVQWRLASRLAPAYAGGLARGLVLTMVIGCLFNSLLLDHTEGLLYAWLTGLLYSGVKSAKAGSGESAAESRGGRSAKPFPRHP